MQLRAFPYKVYATPDASFVATSFMHHLYILDGGGALTGHFSTVAHFPAAAADFSKYHSDRIKTESDVIEIGNTAFELTTTLTGAPWEASRWMVSDVCIAEDGNACVVAVDNSLIWLSRDGRPLYNVRLPVTRRQSIVSLKASADARTVVVRVDDLGVLIISGGRVVGKYKGAIPTERGVELCEQKRLVLIGADRQLDVYNFEGTRLLAIPVSHSVRSVVASTCGRWWFTSGARSSAYVVDWSELPNGFSYRDTVPVSARVKCAGATDQLKKPSWTVPSEENSELSNAHLSPNGRLLLLHVGRTTPWRIYEEGKQVRAFKTSRDARSYWNSLVGYRESRKSPLVRFRGRTATIRSARHRGRNYTFRADARIEHASVSPNSRHVAIAAGSFLYLLNGSGQLIHRVRFKAVCVFPDDNAALLAIGRQTEITQWSANGDLERQITLPDRQNFDAARTHGWIALTSGPARKLWVIRDDLCELWCCGDHAYEFRWASDAPVLMTYARRELSIFSFAS